ncbi:MAG: hypothetical protein BYD32DRAFT_459854 [Podila humilis]|nr:MAG: hypothetical protein BYD32DRAFT_459854 [Podila humilis]
MLHPLNIPEIIDKVGVSSLLGAKAQTTHSSSRALVSSIWVNSLYPDRLLVLFALGTLSRLTSLRLSRWTYCSLDDIAALAQNNPNLETLALGSRDVLKPTTELTLCFCPIPNALKCIHGSQDAMNDYVLHTRSFVAHPGARRHMVHLKLPLNKLTVELGDTLLDHHSDTLQTVKFFVKSFDEDDFTGVNSILAACSNLTSFPTLTGDNYRFKDSKSQIWSAEDIGVILILRWTC